MATIKVTIQDGKTKIDVEGAVGNECKTLTEAIEKAIGGQGESQYKPEFYVQDEQGQVQ